jgi:hypothetical protein
MNAQTNVQAQDDMADLLDDSIDDLADLPEFKPYPAGAHRATIYFSEKEVNGAAYRVIDMKAIETLELNDPVADQPLVAGAETSVMYQKDNVFAQGKFKPIIVAIANHFGTKSISDAMNQGNGMEVTVITKIRENKDKTQKYTDLHSIIID